MSLQSKIVLLSGWKKSGKSTVARYLVKELGYVELSIATPLKDLVSQKYDIPRSWMDDQAMKEKPLTWLPWVPNPAESMSLAIANEYRREVGKDKNGNLYWTPRLLCMMEGSAARAVDPNHWVDKLLDELDYYPGLRVVVSDVRYPNEVREIQKFYPGTPLIRVVRHDISDSMDVSERSLDAYDWQHTLDNTGNLDELYIRLHNLRKEHKL